jgi:DNA-binding MltR family transcriptional regulator
MELKEISDLLDEKLAPINNRLSMLESKVDILTEEVRAILKHVPVGNEDIVETLTKSRKRVA